MEIAIKVKEEKTVGQLLKIIVFGKSNEDEDDSFSVKTASYLHKILETIMNGVYDLFCHHIAICILIGLGLTLI